MTTRKTKTLRLTIFNPGIILAVVITVLVAQPAMALGACSATAQLQFNACRHEIQDDRLEAYAICMNETEDPELCVEEADEEFVEAREECRDQREARRDLCDLIGEAPYDPSWDYTDFDPDFITVNTYRPLGVGDTWSFEGDGETIDIEVLDKYKDVDGVTCIVVQDVVHEDGDLVEDTFDWFAQALDGAVHYCGELARDYEIFEDDDPVEPELVEIEGSFKHARDGDKSGILMPATPVEGDVYRQEWSVGNAEDAAEVLATDYGWDIGYDDLDAFAPQALVEHFCASDCLVTREFSPLEPDAEEYKYFAPGIGLFLEVDTESGDFVPLVSCNLGGLCVGIPAV